MPAMRQGHCSSLYVIVSNFGSGACAWATLLHTLKILKACDVKRFRIEGINANQQIQINIFEKIPAQHSPANSGRLGTRQWTASRVCHQTSRGQYHKNHEETRIIRNNLIIHGDPEYTKLLDDFDVFYDGLHIICPQVLLFFVTFVSQFTSVPEDFSKCLRFVVLYVCFCATVRRQMMTGTWPDAGWEITFETSTILRTALVPWEPATNSRGWEIMEMRWRKNMPREDNRRHWEFLVILAASAKACISKASAGVQDC